MDGILTYGCPAYENGNEQSPAHALIGLMGRRMNPVQRRSSLGDSAVCFAMPFSTWRGRPLPSMNLGGGRQSLGAAPYELLLGCFEF